MSFKTREGKFKCEECESYFIEEDEKLCANCQIKADGHSGADKADHPENKVHKRAEKK